jgi:hypothetical protein
MYMNTFNTNPHFSAIKASFKAANIVAPVVFVNSYNSEGIGGA